jgi:thiol-disulfide isomerase/thioredoxin
MVAYQMGEYKKGFPIMQEVIKLGEKKSIDHNNTYALLAEKVLPAKQYKKEMEEFVKMGKASSVMFDGLKRVFKKETGSEESFENYLTALKEESSRKMMADLRKKMINEVAPAFTLFDLQGNKVNFADLKGKTVIVDFWATWCGPCISSFPGMQKAVNKYADDPNVKFVFIDTWENGDDQKKKVEEFITTNKYNFHVLLDSDSKVVEKFKVDGIPTKFIVDKNGKIRFKSVGFSGSDEQLIDELSAMIRLIDEEKKVL